MVLQLLNMKNYRRQFQIEFAPRLTFFARCTHVCSRRLYIGLSNLEHFQKVVEQSPAIMRFVGFFNKFYLGKLPFGDFVPRRKVSFANVLQVTVDAFNTDIFKMQEQVNYIAMRIFSKRFKVRNQACIATAFKQKAQTYKIQKQNLLVDIFFLF